MFVREYIKFCTDPSQTVRSNMSSCHMHVSSQDTNILFSIIEVVRDMQFKLSPIGFTLSLLIIFVSLSTHFYTHTACVCTRAVNINVLKCTINFFILTH